MLETALDTIWDLAIKNQKENEPVMMYAIGEAKNRKRINWIETYLIDNSGFGLDSPPGDNYHQWGRQEESEELTKDIKEKLEKGMIKGRRVYVVVSIWPKWLIELDTH